MEALFLTPWFVFALTVVVVLFLLASLVRDERQSRPTARTEDPPRRCYGCGRGHPAWARYCRRCGRRLWHWN